MGLFSTQALDMKSLLIHKHILEKRIVFLKSKCGTSQGTSFCWMKPSPWLQLHAGQDQGGGLRILYWAELSFHSFLTSMECLAFKWKPPNSIWTVLLIFQPSKPNHSFWNICSSPKTCKASANIVLIRTEYTATDIQYITCLSSATMMT